MRIRELLMNENATSNHLERAYSLDLHRAMTPDGQVMDVNPRDDRELNALPIGTIMLNATLHDNGDSRKVSYEIYRKAADAPDTLARAWEFVEYLDVSPYAKGGVAIAAFDERAKHLI